MKKALPKQFFWVTNKSPRNVTLADLALNIKAFSTVNLLDSKHYNYTIEQLLKSKESGSLFAKSNLISVRNIPPPVKKKEELPIIYNSFISRRERSIFEIKNEEYAELQVSEEEQKMQDEIYARENADLAELDQQRSVINPQKV